MLQVDRARAMTDRYPAGVYLHKHVGARYSCVKQVYTLVLSGTTIIM